jgi:short-subunit dehydrogenase
MTDQRMTEARGPRASALVTGASTGIGRAFAERLGRDQHDLVLVARDAERLEALAKELSAKHGAHAEVLAADLTDPAGLARVEERLRSDPPDLLVNNAGFGTVGRFAELDLETEEGEIRLNVLALMRLTHVLVPTLIERGRGGIINVSSLAGESPGPFMATYAGTKAFVTTFTESLAEELRGTGVHVQAVLPGFTKTEFQARAGVNDSAVPGFAWLTAEEVVDASLAALEKGQVLCVPGAGYRALATAQKLIPRGLMRRLYGESLRRTLD